MGHELKRHIAPGEEQYDEGLLDFDTKVIPAVYSTYTAYAYRHTDGDQFYYQAVTLAQCRQKRDEWLKQKQS
jgi:hypothetical protein